MGLLDLILRLSAVLSLAFCAACGGAVEPVFVAQVVEFVPGPGAGYGADAIDDVVTGPPEGGGESIGGTDVLSLGVGGSIRLELSETIFDIPGPDFLVFENPFRYGEDRIFQEPGEVSVSEDGETWVTFPCTSDIPSFSGCAGRTPVYANETVSPHQVEVAGGDAFSLEDVELDAFRFIQILDKSTEDAAEGSTSSGFDLDAVANIIPVSDAE